jgi:hypothetical protein
MFDDDQETPNDLITVFEFPNSEGGGDKKKILQFEVRHWVTNRELANQDTSVPGNDYMTSSANEIGNLFYGSEGFMSKTVQNWKTYVGRERTPGDVGEGLGNHYQDFIDAIRAHDQSRAKGDIEEGFYSCALIHLGNIAYRLGRTIEFDPERMKIVGDEEANAMLTRAYRAPFVVPERV